MLMVPKKAISTYVYRAPHLPRIKKEERNNEKKGGIKLFIVPNILADVNFLGLHIFTELLSSPTSPLQFWSFEICGPTNFM